MISKCPICGEEMFPIYYGDENFYKDITYKRCMNCNYITSFKKEEIESNETVTSSK
jgi:RNA polymerase subunit RPABC4/transcription elongation factor Spt4